MKYGITLIFSLLFCAFVVAQPANDECSTAIDLGMAPFCDDTQVFTNVDATESNIGIFNVPTCFENGVTPRDVWFTFTASDTIENYRITVTSTAEGDNEPILNPQVTLYRGACVENGLAELLCASADAGDNEVRIDVNQLTLGVTYFLRINDYTATGTPNAGDFNICIEQRPPISLINEGGSTLCSGTLYDTGGPDGNYGDDEDFTYVICPSQPNQCINLSFTYYNLEFEGGDEILIFDGDDTDGTLIADISNFGNVSDGGAVCFEVSASSGCVTVQFISDGSLNLEGFEASWECSNVPCVEPLPITIDTEVTPDDLGDAIRGAQTQLTVTDFICPDGAFGVFNGEGTDLGLNSGIILSSGSALYAIGPNNNSGFGSQGNPGPGDEDLNTISELLGSTDTISEDACVLELEVFANTEELVFEYIFGSEEYPEFVDQFNDIFAFFISGPGIDGDPALNGQRNIAVLPNAASTIVQIDSVNNGDNFQYYRTNELGQSIQYDGLTSDFLGEKKSLTARSPVIPCNTYNLKLAVADRGDNQFDSGVFISDIRGGAPEAFVNFQGGIDYLVEDCLDVADTLVISLFNQADTSVTYDLVVGGTATPDMDYIITGLPTEITFVPGPNIFTFPITVLSDLLEEGTETIIFDFVIDFGCGATVVSSLTVELRDQLEVEVNMGVDTVVYCIDGGVSLTAEGAETFAWTPPGIFDDPFAQTVFAMPEESTLVTVVGALGNCTDTTLVFLQEVDPMIEITTGDTLRICQGDTIQLMSVNNLEDNNLTWVPTFGFISDENDPNPFLAPQFSVEYEVSVELAGCVVSDSIFLDVDVLGIPTVINDTIICEGYPIVLADIGFNGFQTDYEWTPGDDFVDPTDPESVLNPTIPSQTYTLISTTQNGACADTQMVTVDIIPSRLEILNGDTLEVCAGYDPIDLEALATPAGGSPIVWQPTAGGLSPNNGPIYTVQPGISVEYFASYTVNNCPQTDSIYIKVDSLPTDMSITLDPFKDPYCQGDTFFLRSPIYDVGDFPGITHMWMDSPGLQTGDSLYNGYVVAQDTSLFFRINSNGACLDTTEVQVNVVTPPMFTLTPMDTSICPGEQVPYLFELLNGVTGTVEWTPDDGTLSCTDCFDPIATPTSSTQYTVELTVEGSDCEFPIMASISLLDPPRINLVQDPIICQGDDIVLFQGGLQGDVTYRLTGGDVDTDNPLTPVSPNTTTTYLLTAVNSCDSIAESVTVTVLEPVTLEITAPDEACVGDLVTISAATTGNGAVVEQYTWIVNGSIVSSQPSFNLEVQESLNISLTYSNPCESLTRTASVLVFPRPSLDLTDTRTICLGESVVLNTDPNAATTTYEWTGSDGFSSTDAAPTVMPDQTTTYTVVATSSNSCPVRNETITIEVIQPYTLMAPADQLICFGESTSLTATTEPADVAGTYVWTTPAGDNFNGPTLDITPDVTGTYTITFVDDAGCFAASTATTTVEVIEELPEVLITAVDDMGNPLMFNDSIFNGTEVTFTAGDAPAGFTYTYDWTGNGDPSTAMGQTITVTSPTPSGGEGVMNYTVTVTSEPGGCTRTATFTLNVIEAQFEVPELITPNGDGTNDLFRVYFNGTVTDYTLQVFNRWGQRVFESSDPRQGWDGSKDGTAQPMDAYLYRIRFNQNGMVVEQDGEFSLIR